MSLWKELYRPMVDFSIPTMEALDQEMSSSLVVENNHKP